MLAASAHPPTLHLAVRDTGTNVLLEVGDNGEGISEENLVKIFTHGFTTKKDGHGFGLHTAANAAAEMHGTMTASSDGPGRGALFTLSLPRPNPAPQDPAAFATETTP
jgi:two-component system NtrC family sensor kinase